MIRATIFRICFFACTNLIAQSVQNPSEMLDVMQIDASQRSHFQDDRPVSEETEILSRLLMRLPQFAQVDVDRWTTPFTNVEQILRAPESHRFQFFDLRGTVTQATKVPIIEEMASRVGFSEYYEVKLQCIAAQERTSKSRNRRSFLLACD